MEERTTATLEKIQEAARAEFLDKEMCIRDR